MPLRCVFNDINGLLFQQPAVSMPIDVKMWVTVSSAYLTVFEFGALLTTESGVLMWVVSKRVIDVIILRLSVAIPEELKN